MEKFRSIDNAEGIQEEDLRRIIFMWKLKVPSKVGIFIWRYLLGRLRTREQLKNRGILVEESDCGCVFCFQVLEDAHHIFDSLLFTRRIWSKVGECIGTSVGLSNEELRNYSDHYEKLRR